MKKAELFLALDESHEEYHELLQKLSADQLTALNTIGEWSFKDVLVHLNMWEAEIIKVLFQARQGFTPKNMFSPDIDENEQNRLWIEANRERPLERVLDDFTAIREQTIRRLDAFTDKELNDPVRFKWLNGRSLLSLIQEFVLDHEKMHAKDLQDWLNRQSIP